MSTRMYTSLCLVNVVILNSTCPHCNRLEPHVKGKGYDVQKLSQEHLADGQITLLDEDALLIFCSCMECAVPNQLYESSSVSKDWLVDQLHQGDAGDNLIQRLKMLHLMIRTRTEQKNYHHHHHYHHELHG